VRDQRLGGALPGTGIGQFGFSARGPLFGFIGALRTEPYQRLERFDIVRQGRNGGVHNLDGIIKNLPDEAENAASAKKICAYPALCGRQLYCGFRQSTPSSRQASCELVSDTTPSFAAGQMNFPRSNRFEYNDIPRPSCQIIFTSAPLRPRKTQRSPANGSREKLCCTIAAKLCMPRRISVWPIAIHTRAPAGIIAGLERCRHQGSWCRRRYAHAPFATQIHDDHRHCGLVRILLFAIVNHRLGELRQGGRLPQLVAPRVNARRGNIVPTRHSQNAGPRRKASAKIWSRSSSLHRRRRSGPVITVICRIHCS
jgi:hypothetical protein